MTEQEERAKVGVTLDDAVELLHQVRVMAAAVLVAFIVVGTLAIVTFVRYRDSTIDFTNLNRVTICDLYQRIDARQPAALHCTKAKP